MSHKSIFLLKFYFYLKNEVRVTAQFCFFFFFNDTATTEIYTLSLHDALPISPGFRHRRQSFRCRAIRASRRRGQRGDRKSTRLNSSHVRISYAVFCLKKKKKKRQNRPLYTAGIRKVI